MYITDLKIGRMRYDLKESKYIFDEEGYSGGMSIDSEYYNVCDNVNGPLIFGIMMQGKTSYEYSATYSEEYVKTFFSYKKISTPKKCNEYAEKMLNAPSTAMLVNDFGMKIPVHIKIKKDFSNESYSGDRKYLNYKVTHEVQWSKEIVSSLQNQAIDFAQKVFDEHQNILEGAFRVMVDGGDGEGGYQICMLKDGLMQYPRSFSGQKKQDGSTVQEYWNGGYGHKFIGNYEANTRYTHLLFSSYNLKNINSLQIYGLALAFGKYLQKVMGWQPPYGYKIGSNAGVWHYTTFYAQVPGKTVKVEPKEGENNW